MILITLQGPSFTKVQLLTPLLRIEGWRDDPTPPPPPPPPPPPEPDPGEMTWGMLETEVSASVINEPPQYASASSGMGWGMLTDESSGDVTPPEE